MPALSANELITLTRYATAGMNAKRRLICGYRGAAGGGGDGGSKMSAKWETAVRDGVTTSLSAKPLDSFGENY